MKKVILHLFLLISSFSLFAQENDYAEINFIGYGGMRKLYLNDQLVTTFGNSDIVKYKIHSKGRIMVTVLLASYRHEGVIEIKENKTYYFLAGNGESIDGFSYFNQPIEKDVFESFKESISKRKKITFGTIEIEEDKNSPIGIITKSENDGPKQGTCFLISNKGYLLTNYHVISGAKTVQVKGIGDDFSTLYGVDVVAVDVDLDLALLKLKNQNISFDSVPYGLNFETSSQGTKAFVLGYPLASAMGEEIKVTEGIISAKSGYKGSISQYQFSAAIQPGNSGSPLFDDNGNIIGVINAKLQGAEGAGYAIKSQYVSTFLKLIENIQIESNQSSISKLALPEKIAILKNNIFIVKTE